MSDTTPPAEAGTEDQTNTVTVYFNPFAFSIEQNNEFLRLGYEVMPLRIPSGNDGFRA